MNTTYFLDMVAGNVFHTKTTPSLPTEYYLGLSLTAPAQDGSNVTEPDAAAGYARVKLMSLGEPTDGVITNEDGIAFVESTGDWGTITHFVIYDSLVGGNLLIYDPLVRPRTVEEATVVNFKTGMLSLSVKNETV